MRAKLEVRAGRPSAVDGVLFGNVVVVAFNNVRLEGVVHQAVILFVRHAGIEQVFVLFGIDLPPVLDVKRQAALGVAPLGSRFSLGIFRMDDRDSRFVVPCLPTAARARPSVLAPAPRPILYRLRQMRRANHLRTRQVRNRPRQLQHAVKRPRRELELAHGRAH
jgi:hypothetical protein